ncbi:hypothetical protein EIP91_005882 [Steccherinum ochraceum]|uniref:F-box domain-containing protein n=1 Tax=Steccherinum ochraceum TaxID=92696 RepID=A0A4R0RLG5_9APHY|nr:hypothetical protein EIP91_005882 [Steccherinum ochraceum]
MWLNPTRPKSQPLLALSYWNAAMLYPPLPWELRDQIFSHLRAVDQSMCSLVSRDWRYIAQRHLLRGVLVRHYSPQWALHSFIEFLEHTFDTQSGIAGCVQRVTITGGNISFQLNRTPRRAAMSIEELSRMLAMLPSLRSLRIDNVELECNVMVPMLSPPRNLIILNIKQSKLNIPTSYSPSALSLLFTLFSSIRRVTLDSVLDSSYDAGLLDDDTAHSRLVPQCHTPTTLCIRDLTILDSTSTTLGRLCDYLRHASHIEVTDSLILLSDASNAKEVIEAFGRSVTRLELHGYSDDFIENRNWTSHCKALCQLTVVARFDFEEFAAMHSLISQSPNTLSSVILHWLFDVDEEAEYPRSSIQHLVGQNWDDLDSHLAHRPKLTQLELRFESFIPGILDLGLQDALKSIPEKMPRLREKNAISFVLIT